MLLRMCTNCSMSTERPPSKGGTVFTQCKNCVGVNSRMELIAHAPLYALRWGLTSNKLIQQSPCNIASCWLVYQFIFYIITNIIKGLF